MTALDEINRDIWEPFAQSYAALDGALFAAILDPDHVRVMAESATILDAAGYVAETERGFARARASRDRLAIAFRFTERIASDDRASERGVYHLSIETATAPLTFHGRFHTVARRTPEGWRLLLDYDDGSADGADFEAARPLDDTAAEPARR